MKSESALARKTFAKLRAQYGKDVVIAPYDLRLELPIDNQTSLFQFSILEDQSAKLDTEIRLNKNDVMFATDMGIFLTVADSVEGAAAAVLQTYPNELVFAPAAGFTPADLEAFYNSTVRLQVGQKEFIPSMHTSRFRYVPETQQSTASNKSEFDAESGVQELPTYYRLSGRDEIKIELMLKKFPGMEVANTNAGKTNRIVILLRGFVIKQGADKKPITRKRLGA